MTIDEAVEYARKVASEDRRRACQHDELADRLEELKAYRETGLTPKEVGRLKQERDGAIEDIPHACEYCAYYDIDADTAPCADCEEMNAFFGEERWEWRGMKEG